MFASSVLMCRPASFGFNHETGLTNSFQKNVMVENINEAARREFDGFVSLLQKNKIEVVIIEDTASPVKPDAVFPNNWFSTHHNGKLFVYPMLTQNRRAEVRMDAVEILKKKFGYTDVIDLSAYAEQNKFLEGTGSMVFDHSSRKCFAVLSPRTDVELLNDVCSELNYTPVCFNALDRNGDPIYHTNVVMCVGDKFCAACLEAIVEKEFFLSHLNDAGLQLIDISMNEMEHFAGNMLMLKNTSKENILVMSDTAFNCLAQEKITKLSSFAKIVHPDISIIEMIGGGSARCMMAELFSINSL